jgi:hypothetical protein
VTAPFNPFLGVLEGDQQGRSQSLKESLFVADKRPDSARWAKVLDLAQRAKLPTDLVDRNFDQLQPVAAPDPDRLGREAPGLAQWMQNVDNATLGKSEVEPLGRVDRGVSMLTRVSRLFGPESETGGALRTGIADLESTAAHLAVAFGKVDPATAAQFIAQQNRTAAELRAAAPAYVHEYQQALEQRRPSLSMGLALAGSGNPAVNAASVGLILDYLRTFLRPRALAYQAVESLPSMGPAMAGTFGGGAAGAAIGSAVPVLGTAVGGTVGSVVGTFAGAAPMAVGAEINAEFARRGVDITDPSALEAAFRNPAVMASIRSKALRAGVSNALVTSLFAGIAGRLPAAAKAAGAGPLRVAGAVAADLGIQAAGQGAATAAGEVAAGRKVEPSSVIESAIANLGASIGFEALGAARRGTFAKSPQRFAEQVVEGASKALQAHQDAQTLTELGAAVSEAPVTASVPERLRELVEMTGGVDANAIYFQTNEWDQHFINDNRSPAAVAAQILGDNGRAYDEAKATGEPLRIPLGDYVSRVMTTPDAEPLLEFARTEPTGMSLREAREYLQELPATLKTLVDEISSSPEAKAAALEENVRTQLEEAGAPAPATNAQLVGRFFKTVASRLGIDVEQLAQRYPLRIQRGEAEQPATIASTLEQPAGGPIEAATRVEYLQPVTAEQPRGRIRLSGGGESTVIELLENADRSTFLHETGHFYLDVLDTEGAGADSPLGADRRTIRDWLGAEGDTPLTREQHEQFARGFEAYLMEGKAPTAGLRGAFYRFRNWLLKIYRDVSALKVHLSEPVQNVFARLLATDEELSRVEQAPLFPDHAAAMAAGMDEARAKKYLAAVDDAKQKAAEELTTRMMAQLRREETTEWRRLRAPIVEEVIKQIDADPAYIARALLQKGTKPDGSPLPEGTAPIKLHRDAVRASYGDEAWKALPKGITVADGVNPNIAAEVLGFPNGRALVDALIATKPRSERIDELADYTMQVRHGERLSESELHGMAVRAVHNEQQSKLLHAEMEYLVSDHFAQFKGIAKELMKKVPPIAAVRAEAERLIGNKPIRELRPDLFEMASARAAREASEAFHAGDIPKAFAAKERQLLATEALRAARAARDQVDAATEQFKEIFRPDTQLGVKRDLHLVNAARAILASYGVGPRDMAAAEYLEPMRRYDPEQYDVARALVDQATIGRATGDFRNLSYNDFVDVRDAVNGLWEQSRRSKQIEIEGRKVDRQQAEAEMIDAMNYGRGIPERTEGVKRAVTEWDKAKRMLMGVRAWLRRAEHWVDAMDGGDPNGPFRKYLFNPVIEGIAKYRVAKRDALAKYLEVAKLVEDRVTPDPIAAPEVNYTFGGKSELLGALLHTGNGSNLRKLLLGRRWGTEREDGTVDSTAWQAFIERMQREGVLSKAEYDYAQGVWDLLESLKPDTQRAHFDMYGRYFDEITAQPFQANGQAYQGGYFPARADPFLVADQAIKREAESFLTVDNAFMFPTTGKGFTKSRVEYNRPLLLNVGQVMSAIDGALRFTYIEPRVRDVARIVMSREFRPTLDQLDPTIAGEMLVPWLQRAATQTSQIPGRFKALDRFYTQLRRRAGMQTLAFHVVNALQNFANIPAAALKVPPARLASALARYVKQPRELAAEINDLSPYMATRMNQSTADVLGQIDELLMNPSRFEQARDFAVKHANILAHGTQSMVDVITWSGAYDDAIAKGHDSDAAVRIADSAVRETQGSGAPEDMARFEAQTPFTRLFTLFSGYFNMNANLNATEFANAVGKAGLKKGAGRALYVYTLGFLLPALMAEGIGRAAQGKPLDEDDDGVMDDLLGYFFGSQFFTAARMVPLVGPITEFGVRQFTGRPADRINASSAITTIERAAKSPKDVYDALHGKLTTAGIRDVLTAIGLLTNLPLAPLAKPIGYLHDLSTGRAPGGNALEILRGLATGYAGATP